MWKYKGLRVAKKLKKENKVEEHGIPDNKI